MCVLVHVMEVMGANCLFNASFMFRLEGSGGRGGGGRGGVEIEREPVAPLGVCLARRLEWTVAKWGMEGMYSADFTLNQNALKEEEKQQCGC
jgi:hypothetical protein